jgi:hypothetical protein
MNCQGILLSKKYIYVIQFIFCLHTFRKTRNRWIIECTIQCRDTCVKMNTRMQIVYLSSRLMLISTLLYSLFWRHKMSNTNQMVIVKQKFVFLIQTEIIVDKFSH